MFEEEEKQVVNELDDIAEIERQFAMIDKQDFEFDFGAIDMNESMHVDMDDYNIIMNKKKSVASA